VNFSVKTDRRLITERGRSERHVLAQVTAPTGLRTRERSPVNVAFVLDRSGSMSGEKIQLAKTALQQALQPLTERDRFALVVYDDVIDIVVESTPGSAEAKRNALERLRSIDARGSTNLAEGWLRGAEQVAGHLNEGVLSRCLLLTDGLANVGMTSPSELERHAGELRRRGVVTSTFGIGADFDENLLQAMALAGGGHFYFIERAQQIPDLITSELGEILEVVARDVAIEITLPDGVSVQPLSTVRVEGSGRNVRVALGDLVSDQELDVILALSFPGGEVGHRLVATFALKDVAGIFSEIPQSLTWEFADQADNDAQTRDLSVDRQVASLYAARAQQEAVRLNRQGNYPAASQAMLSAASQIQCFAGDDPAINATLLELEAESRDFTAPMSPMHLKERYYKAHVVASARDKEGKAKRR
jgi:Ca-activated chloride channel family protein